MQIAGCCLAHCPPVCKVCCSAHTVLPADLAPMNTMARPASFKRSMRAKCAQVREFANLWWQALPQIHTHSWEHLFAPRRHFNAPPKPPHHHVYSVNSNTESEKGFPLRQKISRCSKALWDKAATVRKCSYRGKAQEVTLQVLFPQNQ